MALSIVRNVNGVRVVKDGTDLLPIVSPYPFRGELSKGIIELSGNVPNKAVAERLPELASQATGIDEVVSRLTLARGEPEEFSNNAEKAIQLLGRLVSGTAELIDGELVVSGSAGTPELFEEILNESLEGSHSGYTVEIYPPEIKPFRFSASKDEESVVLEGFATGTKLRTSLANLAADLFSNAEIDNRLQIAGGAPPGFADVVSTGVGMLQRLNIRCCKDYR